MLINDKSQLKRNVKQIGFHVDMLTIITASMVVTLWLSVIKGTQSHSQAF